MASLKDIRTRKKSIQSTKKITAAMKMIASSKLRKAQEHALSARPYADLIARMLDNLLQNPHSFNQPSPFLLGNGQKQRYLIVVLTSDRSLCGSFNSSVIRQLRTSLKNLDHDKKLYQFLCVGRKGYDILHSSGLKDHILDSLPFPLHPRFIHAQRLAQRLEEMFLKSEFDVCQVIYNKFISAIQQTVTLQQLIPFEYLKAKPLKAESPAQKEEKSPSLSALYEYEPDEHRVLSALLVKNLAIQMYGAMLENAASEHAARMMAMDVATRNADAMIKTLDLRYNQTRQALVTRELIEIISGAEAL